jgi:hypothetical protein
MTESDWNSSTDPQAMLSFLREHGVSQRKLRLFAVACSRRIWHSIDDLGRAAVEVAESFADGLADAEQLRAARLACKGSGRQSSWYAAVSDPSIAARNAALSALDAATNPDRERVAQTDILRCIFGDPIKTITFDESWRTSDVVAMARGMYEERDFSGMPKLGMVLQDAGCEEEGILNHCREGKHHVRGCWMVDAVLGKS